MWDLIENGKVEAKYLEKTTSTEYFDTQPDPSKIASMQDYLKYVGCLKSIWEPPADWDNSLSSYRSHRCLLVLRLASRLPPSQLTHRRILIILRM
jgi:hypothetical protein